MDKIARAAGAEVRYEYQQGKGNVIRSMFRDIDAECYIMTDGDDTYPAAIHIPIPFLLRELKLSILPMFIRILPDGRLSIRTSSMKISITVMHM